MEIRIYKAYKIIIDKRSNLSNNFRTYCKLFLVKLNKMMENRNIFLIYREKSRNYNKRYLNTINKLKLYYKIFNILPKINNKEINKIRVRVRVNMNRFNK